MKSKELLLKHLALNDCKGYITSDGRLYKAIIDALNEAINYKHCSELLTDIDKEKLIEHSYWLNLQNLSGREPFDKAFKLGIEVGIEEMTEYLQNKEIV